jgi:signal transduction histidine kinase
MERSFAIAILAVIHGLIFLFLIAILLGDRWRRSLMHRRRLSRKTSRIEQLLISETISACVLARDLRSLASALGKRAAELNGCGEWVVWMGDRGGNFRPAAMEGDHVKTVLQGFSTSAEKRFFEWVRNNGAPMLLGKRVEEIASTETIKTLARHMSPGLVIPFLDGQELMGLALLGGSHGGRERRSEQFLTLYGAIAAILIRKVTLDEEDRVLRERQYRAENLAAMGKVAAGVAHEIRNPLTFIRSAAEQLRDSPRHDGDSVELFGGMLEEIDRINTRIEELRSLTKIDTVAFTTLDLEEVIRSSVRLVEASARENHVELRVSLGLQDAALQGNADKLRQLFLNLLLNGIEAMPKGGELGLEAESAGGWAIIRIRDDGPGISPEAKERIFEPFFTTKEGGTGLGLAICYGIAGSHGGSVEVLEAGPGGTCFAVRLPVITAVSEGGAVSVR